MYLGSCQLDAAYLGSCKLDKIYLGMCEVLSGAPVLPAFQANVPNPDTGVMDDVAIGVGGLTETRAGSLWAEDFEGINREFLAQEVARRGGRVVRNLMNTGAWLELSGGVYTDNGDGTYTASNLLVSANAIIRQLVDSVAGYRYMFSIDVKGEGANIGKRIRLQINTSILIVTLASEFVRYEVSVDATISGVVPPQIRADSVVGTRADACIFKRFMTERQDLDQPLIPNDYPGASAGQQVAVYGTDNGNTVVGNVVTEAKGQDLPETPKLVDMPEATNTFLNNYAPATQDIAGQTGTRTCWLEGTGSVTLSGGMSGVVTDGNPVTGDPAGVTVTCTVSGTPDFVMFEDNNVPTAPIPTEGTPETRPACAMSFDAANHEDAVGTYFLEVQFGTNGQGIFSDFLRVISSNVRLNDGAHFADVPGAVDTPYKIGIVYGGGTMKLNVNGVWSADTDYNGSLPDGVLDLFRSSSGINYAGLIERYDVKDESIIDRLMG